MKLYSPDFEREGRIPKKFTCQGEDVNPTLKIDGVPENAVELVLLMDDPDVPSSIRADNMWDHWVLYNINPKTTEIREDSIPEGSVEGLNTSGKLGYQGPCPPDREHRYYFKLYALREQLNLPEGKTKKEVLQAMQGKVLEECELMARYEKT